MEQTPQLELQESQQESESVTHLLFENGDITKPLPPFCGMALGHGTPKMYTEWLRMYILVGPHGKLTSPPKSIKRRLNFTNSREYGWVCSDKACDWNVNIVLSNDKSEWKVKSCDDHHSEGCTSVANPTQKEILNLLKHIPYEGHDMNDLMVKIESAFRVTRDQALYRKLWNAKKILFGKRVTTGSSYQLSDPIPVQSHGDIMMDEAMTDQVTSSGKTGENLELNVHDDVTVKNTTPSTLPSSSLDVFYILYTNGHPLFPRQPFYGMNLGLGNPKIYGVWLRMTQLFSPSGKPLPRQRDIKKIEEMVDSNHHGWCCADPNCTWRVEIVWRHSSNCWFVRGLTDHSEQCTSTATASQAVVVNTLNSEACPNAGSISNPTQMVEQKAYSKFGHAKNMLSKRKAQTSLTSSQDSLKAARGEDDQEQEDT